MSQPSASYSDSYNNRFPLITYPPLTPLFKPPCQPFQIFKPYSQQSSTHLCPETSFVKIIKTLYRPYTRKILHEEIKAEDEPTIRGLDVVSEAVEVRNSYKSTKLSSLRKYIDRVFRGFTITYSSVTVSLATCN